MQSSRAIMIRNSTLVWCAFAAAIATVMALVALVVVLWPPDLFVGLLLAALIMLPCLAIVATLVRQRRRLRAVDLSSAEVIAMSDEELLTYRLDAMAEFERSLELRELRLARQIRTYRLQNDTALDLLEANPSDAELSALVDRDRELIQLIDKESRLVFDRIRANRYGTEDGVDTALIFADIRGFVEQVAQLYRPGAEDVLLETDIERIVKSFSSASLHLLMVVDTLPLNLKSYNTAKIYRLVRRGAAYYGSYKAFRPYLEHGLNGLQVARLVMGINPVFVGATWLAGKVATLGAKTAGKHLMQRTALQLVNDFIRVIGFEAAMMYGGGFQHRDANWLFGAELVNLEVSRGDDLAGRDAALAKLCNLVLRNEFDRVYLLTRLSRHQRIDVSGMQAAIVLTASEREHTARELLRHCKESGVWLEDKPIIAWRRAVEELLEVELNADLLNLAAGLKGSRWSRIKGRFRSWP